MDVVLGPAPYGYYQRRYSIANALIADVGTLENKAQIFGLLGAAFGLGFIVGPALGGIIGLRIYAFPSSSLRALPSSIPYAA